MAKYTIDQINVGDEIIYKYKYKDAGYPNWKVVKKLDKTIILIEINEGGIHEKRMIDVDDVQELVSSSIK